MYSNMFQTFLDLYNCCIYCVSIGIVAYNVECNHCYVNIQEND